MLDFITLNPPLICKRLTIQRVLSQVDRGCILAAEDDAGGVFRVRYSGSDLEVEPGDVLDVHGRTGQFRDRFGRLVEQIESTRMDRVAAYGSLIGPYLQRLPNIGPERARRLTAHFQSDLVSVLSDVSRCDEVAAVLEPSKPSLAARLAMQVYASVAQGAGANELRQAEVEFLVELEKLGLSDKRVSSRAWRFLAGVDAIERLKRNPYLLSTMIPWREADKIGRRILEQADEVKEVRLHPARLCGAVQSVWRDLLSEGHTAVTPEDMKSALERLRIPAEDAIRIATEKRLIRPSDGLLRAPGAAFMEDQVVSCLYAMETREPTVGIPTAAADLERLVFDAECQTGLNLHPDQRAAVAELLCLPVAGLQGGAGVGKTTVMKVLADAFESVGGNVVLSAVAGKAALTLARGASSAARPRVAFTIARLIGMLERRKSRQENPAAKIPAGDVELNDKTLLIIDEAGMLDTPSLHRLMSLLPEGSRLLFAGDAGQLPPVGPGAFFRDLVNDGSRVVTLTKVLRQSEGSAIPTVAAQIRQAVAPHLLPWNGESEGVFTVPFEQLFDVQKRLRSCVETLVVAALRSTVQSINVNMTFDGRRGDGRPEIRLAPSVHVAVGDPVVMTQNRYAEGLYNGLLGVVTAIGAERIEVQWDGNAAPSEVTAEAAAHLELAYAITCHKSQGSAADAVLVAVENAEMVTREWLYTAVTRGRKLVLLAAEGDAIEVAVNRRTVRCTGLRLMPRTIR